jgi:hypothetical protein
MRVLKEMCEISAASPTDALWTEIERAVPILAGILERRRTDDVDDMTTDAFAVLSLVAAHRRECVHAVVSRLLDAECKEGPAREFFKFMIRS